LAFSYWIDKPWFLTEEKFVAVLIIPSSWGSQQDGDLHQHRAATSNNFLALLLGKKNTSARRVSHAHPLLYFSFALLYFCLHHFIKNTKKLVSFIVVISLLLVHHVVP
jgi:hypothetical protein